jgi:hypothetical protein
MKHLMNTVSSGRGAKRANGNVYAGFDAVARTGNRAGEKSVKHFSAEKECVNTAVLGV